VPLDAVPLDAVPLDAVPLDPDAATYLERLRAAGGPALTSLTPEQARAAAESTSFALAGEGEPVAEVRDVEVAGVPVREYVPEGAHGTTVYAHGGGWVVGSVDTHDVVCRSLARRSGSRVLSVGYRLAPDARHPVQVEQVGAVLRGAGPGPLAAAGDSAGAHLVALAAVAGDLPLAGLALVYPVVEPGLDRASARDNAEGYGLTTAAMRWYWDHYLPAAGAPGDVPVSLLDADLAALPPTLVLTAGYDPLRDEGLALADALEAAGVPVHRSAYDGQVHGFFRMTALVRQSRQAHDEVGAFLRACLTKADPSPAP